MFVDHSLGRHEVVSALRAAGAEVRVHDDFFAQDVEDVEWLTEAGERGWIVLTKDARIRQRINERTALRRAGAKTVVLTSQHLTGQEMARIFAAALPKIARLAARHHGPFIATLTRGGSLKPLAEAQR